MKNQGSTTTTTHRTVAAALATVLFGSAILGCPFLKKKDEDPTADAALAVVSGTGAKNEASVLRYANEVPIANEPAVIGKDGAKVRNFPPAGPEITTLAKGTVVAKMASYFSTGILIMFDDPSGDGSKLMGWVSPSSFDVTAPAPTKTVWVPKPDAGPKDAGGGAAVVDAGVAGKDAGSAPTPTADAGGGGAATPGKGAIAVAPIDGKCPDAWALQADKMCRRKCTKEPDPICPRTTKCVSGSGGKICSTGN